MTEEIFLLFMQRSNKNTGDKMFTRVSGLALAKVDRPIICRITWKPAMREKHDSGALRRQDTFKAVVIAF